MYVCTYSFNRAVITYINVYFIVSYLGSDVHHACKEECKFWNYCHAKTQTQRWLEPWKFGGAPLPSSAPLARSLINVSCCIFIRKKTRPITPKPVPKNPQKKKFVTENALQPHRQTCTNYGRIKAGFLSFFFFFINFFFQLVLINPNPRLRLTHPKAKEKKTSPCFFREREADFNKIK